MRSTSSSRLARASLGVRRAVPRGATKLVTRLKCQRVILRRARHFAPRDSRTRDGTSRTHRRALRLCVRFDRALRDEAWVLG